MSLILHGYWRSGAAYRTRLALNLKGLSYEQRGIDLRTGAQQKSEDFLAAESAGDGAGAGGRMASVLTQSPAILEWLEETHTAPAGVAAVPMRSGERRCGPWRP